MKNTIRIISFLITSLLLVSLANAVANTTRDFATVQSKILQGINAVEAKLDKIETNIQNSNAEQSTKDQALATIATIRSSLDTFKAQVEAAQSMDDLLAIKQQIKDNLIANQGVLKAQIQQSIASIAATVSVKANELYTLLDQTLSVLKITCSSQATNIDTLDQDIDTIKTKAGELTQLVKNKAPSSDIKAKISEINAIAKDIKNLALTIKTACGI